VLPRLHVEVTGAAGLEHAAVPTLRFALAVRELAGRPVRSVLLDTQVQIAARRRSYDAAVHDRLFQIFGAASDWGSTLRTLLWTRTTLVVPPFTGATAVDLDVPCSYDLQVLASAYLDALDGGEVPLELLFSGSVFYADEEGRLQAARIPWDLETTFRLPVATWKATMDRHFRGTAFVRLRKDTFDALASYRSRRALPTWDAAIEELLT
jgi:Family of unknown function (DUF6084)